VSLQRRFVLPDLAPLAALLLLGAGCRPAAPGAAAAGALASAAPPDASAADARWDAGTPSTRVTAPAVPAPDPGATAPERGPGYYRYVDGHGTVHFVASLAEVPASAEASARRIAIGPHREPASSDALARTRAAAPTRTAFARTAPAPTPAAQHDVVLYSTSWCPWCRKARAWLDARGVRYEDRDIEADPEFANELLRKSGGRSVPVFDIDGRIVRGFDPATLQRLL
jgi:glutaredoxin-like YruB-family protein